MKASLLRCAPRHKLLCALVASCFAADAYANPTGPSTVSGSAAFSTVGSTLTVTNSPNAIINWQGFSIAAGEATRFQQQSAASAVLNRVVGQDPSAILGTLWSNGRVFLVNPNGILFGQGSRVDVAGLVASTLNISDADFLGGRLNFQAGAVANSLVNEGQLHSATGGHIYLVSPDITNSGLISSPKGEVVLAAGRSVSLVDIGTPNLKVEVTAPEATARNLGQIVADSGRIGIYAGLVHHSGVVRADSAVVGANGQIVFKAARDLTLATGSLTSANGPSGGSVAIESGAGLTQLAGRIEVRGDANAAGNDGGSVTIKADRLIHTGAIDATGASGGSVNFEANRYLGSGTINASGAAGDGGRVGVLARDYLIQTEAESLAADGSTSGKGGAITVQAAQRVFSSASISAQGAGEAGGDVRVLAGEVMLFGARINASGEAGGTVLIGGDYKGGNPAIPSASRTWINYSTTIRADAGQHGNGGRVIVWSDQDTRYAGDISARGGAQSGNGGFIEVSGKENLIFAGTADASASNGTPGTVLLDPKNIVIDSTGGGLSSFLLVDPNVGTGDGFGQQVVVLDNNNVVVTDPSDDFAASNAGAVYLFNGVSGALISTLTGSSANDQVGFAFGNAVVPLANGNYVVRSRFWDNGTVVDAGAVTFGNGSTGISGAVSSTNSLVGTTASDVVGAGGVLALANGNYVVRSANWDNGTAVDAGAVTFGNGTTGISGSVSSANSLVGTLSGDFIGNTLLTELTNGNYVVRSPSWHNGSSAANAGAVTFGSGTSGVSGVVSSANSLVGTAAGDSTLSSVTALSNGNYVVSNPFWDGTVGNAGAVTFGNGTAGISGVISSSNSLVGTLLDNQVGGGGVTALTNGNYVVSSPNWEASSGVANVGAVTFGNGTSGITGAVSSSNSLVGTTAGDSVGDGGVTALTNGNYVVSSPNWDNPASVANVGAVTFGNGTSGISGAVSSSNSLVGTTASDFVGSVGVTALTNGNYVVSSPNWHNDTVVDAGAVTFGSGTTGISGAVSSTNSLVGTMASDRVGDNGVTALTNGNYVVVSPFWDNGAIVNAGAVTFGNGTTGISGAVSSTNSLVGATANSFVGDGGITVLTNGNYVVVSPFWDNGTVANAGAVTFGNGATGISGAVSSTNSLVGTTGNDLVGNDGVTALTNGNYIVVSPFWNNGTELNAGAVTFGNGATGISGAVSSTNSLVGSSTGDRVGIDGVTELLNGNFVVKSRRWNGDKGAATFGSGTAGVTGVVSSANSLVGNVADDLVTDTCGESCLEVVVVPFANGNYAVVSSEWNNGTTADVGAVTFGSGATGVSGTVSTANSLLGVTAGDRLGVGGVTGLGNGNFVVSSPQADNGTTVDAGLVHVVGLANPLSFSNNAAGTTTITPLDITAITNTGSALTLQANNDIAVNAAVTTNNPSGAGGAITMQAGRSVLINASITTDDANLSVTANDATAQAANRDSGAGGITMATGTTLNTGTGTVALTVGPGASGAASGNLVVENIVATNVNLQQNGQTSGSSILRASSSSLIQATNLLMEVDHGGLATGGSVGTSTEPMRIQAAKLEAHTHEASPGIFIDSPNAGSLQIGGVPFFTGSVKGVQNVTSGDIVITANTSGLGQKLTLAAGSAPSPGPCGVGATGGPVCTTSGNVILRADDMDIGNVVRAPGSTVTLTPYSTARNVYIATSAFVSVVPVGLVLHTSELALISAGTLEIGRDSDSGILQVNNGGTVAPFDISAFGTVRLAHEYVTVSTNITSSAASQSTLEIRAKEDIFFFNGADVTSSVSGLNVILNADRDGNSSGAISLGSGTVIGSNGGNITLGGGTDGTGFAFGSASVVEGVLIDGAELSAGAGNIAIRGQGLGDGGSFRHGVSLLNGGKVLAAGGTIDITGIGGANASGDRNHGVNLQDAGTLVSSTGGTITITGTGGSGAAQTNTHGVAVGEQGAGAIIQGSGSAIVNVTGTGGTTGGINSRGVIVEGEGSKIVAENGAINIIGIAPSATSGSFGVQLFGGGDIISTGGGAINVTGTAQSGGASLNGGASGTSAVGGPTATGDIEIVGNQVINLSGGSSNPFNFQTTGNVTLNGSNGAAQLGGAGSIQAAGLRVLGQGTFSLDSSANVVAVIAANITGAGSSLSYRDANALTIGSVLGTTGLSVSGPVTLVAGGAITQTAPIAVGGAASFDTGANPITLTNSSNDFTGAVSLNNSGPNDVALADMNALILGASSVGSGTLTIIAGGAITQTGPIVQASGAGEANFITTVAGSAITLTNAGNDFTGPVDADTTGNVAITDANSFIIEGGGGPSTTSAASFTLNANGTVSQSGSFTGVAPPVVVINAGSGSILLNDPGNDFSGNVSVALSTTGAVSLVNANAGGVNLAASTVGGALSLTSGGPVTQTGALTVGGTTTVNAGANPVTLTNSGNDFGTLVVTSSGDVTLTDANAITIGTSSVAGAFNVSAPLVSFLGDFSANNFSFTSPSYTLQSGTLNLAGTTTVSGSSSVVVQGGTLNASSGTIDVAGTLQTTSGALSANTVNVSGVFNVSGGTVTTGSVNVLSGGFLVGNGTLTGNVSNSGIVSPGASPGTLTISGNYVQGPSGVLYMDIGGTTAGSQYDQLVVSGNVSLGGTLSTELIGGFVPIAGNTFTLIQAGGALSGTFGTIVQPTGTTFNSFYGPTTFEFSVPSLVSPGSEVITVIEPSLNYTVVAIQQTGEEPLAELLAPVIQTEGATTAEGEPLDKRPPRCN